MPSRRGRGITTRNGWRNKRTEEWVKQTATLFHVHEPVRLCRNLQRAIVLIGGLDEEDTVKILEQEG